MRALVPIMSAIWMLVAGAGSALAADAVLVTTPRGAAAKVANVFVDTMKRDVAPAKIIKGPALKVAKVSERVQALTKACAAKRAGFAVDAMIEGKKSVSVVVVAANGDVLYQHSSAYPKAAAKQRSAMIAAAKAAAKVVKDASATAVAPPVVAAAPPPPPVETPAPPPPAETSGSDAFSAGATPPWMTTTPSAASTPSLTSPSSTTTTSETPLVKETATPRSSSGGGRGDFRIGIGGLGGGAGYTEHIDSSRDPGDRDVKISMAPSYGGQLELEHAVGFRLDAMVLKQSATLKPDVTNPEDITVDQLRIGGRASWALTDGDVPIAIALGGGYEKADTNNQIDILWVPSNTLITTFVGATVSSGDLTTVGFTFEGGAGVVPWGKHSRTADIVKIDSRALGGQGWFRARYQIPKALGSSAGFFFELGAQLRYLTLTPGSVTLPAEDGTVRTSALPVGDASSSRFDYGAGASIGIMWRPGD